MTRRIFSIFFLLLAAVPCLRAQTDSLLREGDRLQRQYRFEEAMDLYRTAVATASADTVRLLRSRIDNCQNALVMTDFCESPVVIARQRFSRQDFFLYYPLKNQGWRQGPNVLDPSSDNFPIYAPKGGRSVCFSAPDAVGSRNLYITRDQDTLWSAPELLGEHLLSFGNEVFPMLSEDEKTLYFSSDGLYGMGGYDLYRSTWDEEAGTWGVPENLGFPYSSPADDFLLADTSDGRYTLFASNRDCSRDSVYIYVLEKRADPVRTPVRDPVALARMASLNPLDDPSRLDHGSAVSEAAPSNDDTRLYMEKMAEARALRDTIYAYERKVDQLRTLLSTDSGESRTALTAAIVEKETALTPLRKQLEETTRAIRLIEQSFLRSGVVSSSEQADREVVGARSSYTFTKNSYGAKLRMKLAAPPAAAESTYKVGPVGRFAQDTSLPAGVTYQIQIFTSARHATLDEIGGLDPVYERLTSSLRYTYSVGLFRTFREALSQLNPIRKLGFPEAEITAFIDGKPVPVVLARRVESGSTGPER